MNLFKGFFPAKNSLIVLTLSLVIVGCLYLPVSAQDVTPSQTINEVLYQPQRIDVALDGRIFVSEPRRNRVRVLSSSGMILYNIMVDRPIAVGLDGQGNVLVGHGTRVDAYQEMGGITYSLGIGEGEFSKPNDLVCSDAGRIFVTDSPNHQVKVYDNSGNHLFDFGTEGTGSGQFYFPTGIALNFEQSEVLVADQGNSRVQVFDLNGSFLRSFGEFTYQAGQNWIFEGTFSRLQGLAVDPYNRIYVTDSYQNNTQILSYDGEFLGFIATDDEDQQYFSLPMDAAVNGNKLYVTSTAGSQVSVFTLDDVTGVSELPNSTLPEKFGLEQNYPNPFNPETNIRFTMPETGWVELTVWDIMGRQVAQLLDSQRSAGVHEVQWHGRTLSGSIAASGIYLYTIKVTDNKGDILHIQNRKMLLLK